MAVLASDVIGHVLNDRYEVLELERDELLGNVYAGLDQQAGIRVAIKILHPHLTEDTSKFKRFGREITNTWMITQKNTVEVLDWGEDDGRHYLVMEYLRAKTLEQVLEEEGALGLERSVRIAVQIARAIGAAHQEGIVHRALAPTNVLLLDNAAEGDFVKVRDFGLSKLEKLDDEDTGLTTQNTRVGNAEYMSPEYIKTSGYHTKGDLYALGALLHHMLTGTPPFSGPTLDVLQAHVSDPPPPASASAADVPEWLDALILSMLSKTPEERPGAYRVVQMLESGLGRPVVAPVLFPLDVNGNVVRPSGPPRAAILMGAALLVGLFAGLVAIGIIAVLAAIVALRGAGLV